MQTSDRFANYLFFLGAVLSKARSELMDVENKDPTDVPVPESDDENEFEKDFDFAEAFGDLLLHDERFLTPTSRVSVSHEYEHGRSARDSH